MPSADMVLITTGMFWLDMMPDIKQRAGAVRPSRKKAAGMFDAYEYSLRASLSGIFGAEATGRHHMFIWENSRRRFGKGRAIVWNMRVLNRFVCAKKPGMPIPSYGCPPQAECA